MKVILTPSSSSTHKFTAHVDGKKVHFGAKGYSDYTKHKDPSRKQRYITRHKARENWNKSGIKTAGFWSRWILWNKPSLGGSIRDTASRFGITISRSSRSPSKGSRSLSPKRSRKRRSRSRSRRRRSRSRSRKRRYKR